MRVKDLGWIDALPDIEDALNPDLLALYGCVGKEGLKACFKEMLSARVLISSKCLANLQRLYIDRHFNGRNIPEMMRTLGVSKRFVYKHLESKCRPHCKP
jgi:hypothetical protein